VGARNERVGANLSGLLIKMERSDSLEEREDKKISVCRCWVGGGSRSIVKLYSCFVARARGLLNISLFFV
jgi:hypothetical protein